MEQLRNEPNFFEQNQQPKWGDPMRKTICTILVLVVLMLGYMASVFPTLYRFVEAVDANNTAEVEQVVDFRTLHAAMAQQITVAYLRRTGTKLSPFAQAMAAQTAVLIAEPLVAKLVVPAAFVDFLRNPPTLTAPDGSPIAVPGISNSSLGTAWETFLHSEYGFGTFDVVVPVDALPDQRFMLRFRLAQWRWRFKGIVLPPLVADALADQLVTMLKAQPP
jgi:hypothetical protein